MLLRGAQMPKWVYYENLNKHVISKMGHVFKKVQVCTLVMY